MICRLGIATLLFTVLAGCQSGQRISQLKGGLAPDFELTALDGGKVRLSALRGKPVLLTFWGHF